VLTEKNEGILYEKGCEKVLIQSWGRNCIRVRCIPAGNFHAFDWALVNKEPDECRTGISEEAGQITCGSLSCCISAQGFISFTRNGKNILQEIPPLRTCSRSGRSYKSKSGDLWEMTCRFEAAEGERFYGLGQHADGCLDQKGCVIDLIQMNASVSVPFALSSKGYGFFWNNPAQGRVELGKTRTSWEAFASRQIDYFVIAGESPADILKGYCELTGFAPCFPEWAAGFWQSKLRYETQEELLGVAREYRDRELPLDIIVADYFHWTKQGEWRFDPGCWPDPEAMVRELEGMGVRLMVSIWPTVNRNSANFSEMEERGFLVRPERGTGYLLEFEEVRSSDKVGLHFYDATSKDARDYLWQKIREGYYNKGIRLWWLDACEPEIRPAEPDNVRYSLGNGAEVGCLYPLLHTKGIYEGMESVGETEILSLCRSAWAGSQRYGALVWSGDIESNFRTLRNQVRAGLNMAVSGIPWWTTDTGGFFTSHTEDPSFRELMIRWFQWSLFTPVFRLHGFRNSSDPQKGGDNEIWSFGDEAYGIIRNLLFLREKLKPYIMEQMRICSEKGIPPMRPVFFDYPSDEEAYLWEDEYLFGSDILVAPVTEEGMRTRDVYLPVGSRWMEYPSGTLYPGGQVLECEAPLESIPVFIREGAETGL